MKILSIIASNRRKIVHLQKRKAYEYETFAHIGVESKRLVAILDMSPIEIKGIIEKSLKMQKKTQFERDSLLDYWIKWKANPIVEIEDASDLTEDERKEFIAKDNIEYGEWDNDELANVWEEDDLVEWGLDIWKDDGKDYSEKNKEIDVNGLNDEVTLKLKFSESKYNQVKLKLAEIDGSPEEAILKLLGL